MTFLSSLPTALFKIIGSVVSVELMALLLVVGGMGVSAPSAAAQTALPEGPPNVPIRNEDGSVRVNNNARDIRTGPLRNSSRIPLPATLPVRTTERVPVSVDRTRQAPNSIEIRPDVSYIEESFNSIVNNARGTNDRYDLQRESLQITTTFDLNFVPGAHAYGEGIQMTVIKRDGTRTTQTAYVRGGRVTIGPGNVVLPSQASISMTYGANDVVELRVLNIRNNGAAPSQSAIYFARDFNTAGKVGEFIVEDLEAGGDLDFDDGEYVQAPTGEGIATVIRETPTLAVTARTERVDLPPFIDQVTSTTERVDTEQQIVVEDIELARDRGQVEIADDDNSSNLLGHAAGVRTVNGEQLIYSRYANASEVRLGSDGLGATGQLRPLISNPSAPPTLLTGNLRFNPFVDDNEAGVTSRLGITQYLTRTHRLAEDVLGNRLVQAGAENSNLLVPTGLFNNRRMVGYVPAGSAVLPGEQLSSVNGVFELPADQEIAIALPDPQRVGRGDSAYTDNVGGLLIERTDGTLAFVPQWTKDGYAQSAIALSAGEATRVIYALVPQQPGQNLQLNQTYTVTTGTLGYVIADGGFKIISADLQPQNFVQESADVYAVEDTVAATNAATDQFNGIQGVYIEIASGERVPTVDVAIAAEADARLGNMLSPFNTIEAAGQPAYIQTTRAGGLYLGGSLTGGFGNQADSVLLSRTTTTNAIDSLLQQRTQETFSSARSRLDTIRTESGTTEQTTGAATFEINEAGELTNVAFTPTSATTTINVSNRETREVGDVELGLRALVESTTEETLLSQSVRELSREQGLVTEKDTYPNFSAVLGELALGGVYNFGNTPWTASANTVRAELFFRDSVLGRSTGGSETGMRAEVVFHPFGEVQRDAYQVDATGNVIPVYQTQPVLDESGKPVVEMLTAEDGEPVEVVVNQFVRDEAGDRIAQRVGTGAAKGPGAYLRAENVFDDGGVEIAGGLQLSF